MSRELQPTRDGAIAKRDLYEEYEKFCKSVSLRPRDPNTFGRIVRQVRDLRSASTLIFFCWVVVWGRFHYNPLALCSISVCFVQITRCKRCKEGGFICFPNLFHPLAYRFLTLPSLTYFIGQTWPFNYVEQPCCYSPFWYLQILDILPTSLPLNFKPRTILRDSPSSPDCYSIMKYLPPLL